MPISTENNTLTHIRTAVVAHAFADPSDWASAISELSCLDDSAIDDLVDGDFFPSLPIGVTADQARRDRDLFDRVAAELGI